MAAEPIVLERRLNAPADRVWEAITDNFKMKQWYFDIADFKPELGFEFSFAAGSAVRKYVHLCKITALIPGKKIAYTWRYEGYPGNSEVGFELFPEGEKTLLKLTHTGLETFPPDDGDFSRESFTAGWTFIVDESLRKFVE